MGPDPSSRASAAPADDSQPSTSAPEPLLWESLRGGGGNTSLLAKGGFQLVEYCRVRDSCLQSNGAQLIGHLLDARTPV